MAFLFFFCLSRNPTNREIAEEKFRSVSDAYQTLSNSERRSEYDALRKFGARTAGAARGGPGGSAFSSEGFFREGSNPFSSAFGKTRAYGRPEFFLEMVLLVELSPHAMNKEAYLYEHSHLLARDKWRISACSCCVSAWYSEGNIHSCTSLAD